MPLSIRIWTSFSPQRCQSQHSCLLTSETLSKPIPQMSPSSFLQIAHTYILASIGARVSWYSWSSYLRQPLETRSFKRSLLPSVQRPWLPEEDGIYIVPHCPLFYFWGWKFETGSHYIEAGWSKTWSHFPASASRVESRGQVLVLSSNLPAQNFSCEIFLGSLTPSSRPSW